MKPSSRLLPYERNNSPLSMCIIGFTRLLVGYRCTKSAFAAEAFFDRILAGLTDDPRLIARAHVCVALAILDVQAWQQGMYAPTEKQVFAAGYHYNEAAKLGYGKCPALLYFVQVLHPQRAQLKSSEMWTTMWAIFAERNEEMREKRRRAAEKLARRPNRYVCAAEGCGIAASKGKVLLQCGFKRFPSVWTRMTSVLLQVLGSAVMTISRLTAPSHANAR
jgi:hypothetical protein